MHVCPHRREEITSKLHPGLLVLICDIRIDFCGRFTLSCDEDCAI